MELTVGTLKAYLGLDSKQFQAELTAAKTRLTELQVDLKKNETEAARLRQEMLRVGQGTAEYKKFEDELKKTESQTKLLRASVGDVEKQIEKLDRASLSGIKSQFAQMQALAKEMGSRAGVGGGILGELGGAAASGAGIMGEAGPYGAAAGAVAVAATAAGASLWEMAKKTMEAGEEFRNLSAETNISAVHLQELQHVAEMAGLDFGRITNGALQFQRQLSAASEDSGKAAAALEKLGVSVGDLSKANMDDLFFRTLEALSGVKNETERAALASQIFGRGYADMAGILALGTQKLDEWRKQAHELGLVLDPKQIEDEAETFNLLGEVWKGLSRGVGKEVLQLFKDIQVQDIVGWAKSVRRGIEDVTGSLYMEAGAYHALMAVTYQYLNMTTLGVIPYLKEAAQSHYDAAVSLNKTIDRMLDARADEDAGVGDSDEKPHHGNAGAHHGPSDQDKQKEIDEQKKALEELYTLRLRHTDSEKRLEMERNHALAEITKADTGTRKAIWAEYQKDIDEAIKKSAEEAAEKQRKIQSAELSAQADYNAIAEEMTGHHFEALETRAKAAYEKEKSELEALAAKNEDVHWRMLDAQKKYDEQLDKIRKDRQAKEQKDKDDQATTAGQIKVLELRLVGNTDDAKLLEAENAFDAVKRKVLEDIDSGKVSKQLGGMMIKKGDLDEQVKAQEIFHELRKKQADELVKKYEDQEKIEDKLYDLRQSRELESIRLSSGELTARLRALDYEYVTEKNNLRDLHMTKLELVKAEGEIAEITGMKRFGILRDEGNRIAQELRSQIRLESATSVWESNLVAGVRMAFPSMNDTLSVQRDSLSRLQSIDTQIRDLKDSLNRQIWELRQEALHGPTPAGH